MTAKRKYTRFGEKSTKHECTNKKCKWQGTDSDKESKELEPGYCELVCPHCGNNEFYGLLNT